MKHIILSLLALVAFTPSTLAQEFNQDAFKASVDSNATSEEVTESYIDGIIPSNNHEIGKKIKEGRIELNDFPIFIVQAIDLITRIAGTIAVLVLVVGGIQYMVGGFSDNTDKGKNTIKYALIGLAVSFLAWVIVNLVQTQLTGGFLG